MKLNLSILHSSKYSQSGMSLFVILSIGVIITLLLMGLITISGNHLVDSKKESRLQDEYFIADGGFNLIQARIANINRESGAIEVQQYLTDFKAAGKQVVQSNGTIQGYFRLDASEVKSNPLTVQLSVLGSRDSNFTEARTVSVNGVVRVPSLARYARYVEGSETLNYQAGRVSGEVLVAGSINLVEKTVEFTRLVSSGQSILNKGNGKFDFGFRENESALPTLDGVNINEWDTPPFDYTDAKQRARTFSTQANSSGIVVYPEWSGKNANANCSQSRTGNCDTLFASCFDKLSTTRRSPAVVAGSAVSIDLSLIKVVNGQVEITVSPVVYDAGSEGKDWIILGTPSKVYKKALSLFSSGIVYFPGDIYVTGELRGISVTLVSGDDVFFYGPMIGPQTSAVDFEDKPVVLGIVAQDQVLIHENTPRKLTIRAAVLAENDEIVYRERGTSWKFGYVCDATIYDKVPTTKGSTVVFKDFFADNFIWDDRRIEQAGFGRETDEECIDATCVGENSVLQNSGFIALGFERLPKDGEWMLDFDGSLITRLPGSKGPTDQCNLGWDCKADPSRAQWSYDTRLSAVSPPGFPSPVIDDKVPALVVGYKQRSFK